MAHAGKTMLVFGSAIASVEAFSPLGIVPEEIDLDAMRTFFELLAEWESKDAKDANRN